VSSPPFFEVYGLCNSPASFQRILDFITSGLPGLFIYLDNVVNVSKIYQQHRGQLRQLLSRFRKYGLKYRLSKLQLAAEEVDYLGYNISKKNGIRPGAIKTESIINWKAPTDVIQIRQFLGLCSFFQRTIESFAQTDGPLTKLTRKDSAWKEGPLPEDAQKAFEQLQSKLSSRPCLTPVDFDQEFILTVDSTSIGVGAILSQFHNKGIEHPCTYASPVLTQAETSYSPCHLEASGLQWSTRHFGPYLIGRHFTIRTDHKPLVSVNKTHSLALDRIYAELIDTLPFTIEYLQGEKMQADGLSRLGQMVSDLAQLNLKILVLPKANGD
jgi:hypothetical protein